MLRQYLVPDGFLLFFLKADKPNHFRPIQTVRLIRATKDH